MTSNTPIQFSVGHHCLQSVIQPLGGNKGTSVFSRFCVLYLFLAFNIFVFVWMYYNISTLFQGLNSWNAATGVQKRVWWNIGKSSRIKSSTFLRAE